MNREKRKDKGMKKANLKTFVKKMLILGFCVPTTFVCSAVPAMAATAAQSTSDPAAGQPAKQVQTDTAQTSTAGKTENSNPQTEESVIGGGSTDQSGAAKDQSVGESPSVVNADGSKTTTETAPNGDITVTVRNADGSIKSITTTHKETESKDITETDSEYNSKIKTNSDGTVVHPNKKITSTTTTTTSEYNNTTVTEGVDHTNHEDYNKKPVYSVGTSGEIVSASPQKTADVRAFMEAVGKVQNASVYADTFNNGIGHSDGDIIVNQLYSTDTIKNTEQIANQNHEDYGDASFSYIGNADKVFDTVRNGNAKNSILILGDKELDPLITSDNTDNAAYRRMYVQVNSDGSKKYYVNTLDDKNGGGQTVVQNGKTQYLPISENDLTTQYPQLKKFEQVIDVNSNLSAIGMTGERAAGNAARTATEKDDINQIENTTKAFNNNNIQPGSIVTLDIGMDTLVKNTGDVFGGTQIISKLIEANKDNKSTIILNVHPSASDNKDTSYSISANLGNGIKAYDVAAAYFIWNFSKVHGSINFTADPAGVIVAPYSASITLGNGSKSGSVIGKNVTSNGEIHMAFKNTKGIHTYTETSVIKSSTTSSDISYEYPKIEIPDQQPSEGEHTGGKEPSGEGKGETPKPTEPGTPSTPATEVPVTPTTPGTPETPSTPSTPSVDTPTVPTNTVINPNPENPKNTEPTTTPTAPVHTTHNDVQNNKSNAQNESGQSVTVTHTGKTVKSTAVSPKTSKRNTASVQNTSSVQPAGSSVSATDASIPKTADQTSLLLYVTLFGGAAAALAAALVLKRKENE